MDRISDGHRYGRGRMGHVPGTTLHHADYQGASRTSEDRPLRSRADAGDRVSTSVEAAVVRRAQSGDHEAFASIVSGSIDRLFALAMLITRDAALAEDAVQDAFARAWRDLPSLRDAQRLSAWLSRLTVNATYDLMRRRKRVRQALPLERASAAASHSTSAVDRVILAEAYDRLPPEQRAVVVLH